MTEPLNQKESPDGQSDSNAGLVYATWTRGILTARVQVKYEHPNAPGIFKVDTVGGEHYAHGFELKFD